VRSSRCSGTQRKHLRQKFQAGIFGGSTIVI